MGLDYVPGITWIMYQIRRLLREPEEFVIGWEMSRPLCLIYTIRAVWTVSEYGTG